MEGVRESQDCLPCRTPAFLKIMVEAWVLRSLPGNGLRVWDGPSNFSWWLPEAVARAAVLWSVPNGPTPQFVQPTICRCHSGACRLCKTARLGRQTQRKTNFTQ